MNQSLIKRPAPDFSLHALDGGRFRLSEALGHIVVVNFWSAECPWSRRADLVLVYRQHAWEKLGIVVVGIASNPNEPESELRYEAEVRQVKYPILLDSGQDIVTLYRAEATPHFFVVDPEGVVRYAGALDDATAQQRIPKIIYLDRAIAAVSANRDPNPTVTTPYGSAIVR
ncbi:MAG: redoxin domain-containing protein [Chloroflexota bacterium]